MSLFPSEYSIYATVSKVEVASQSSKSRGSLHLFVLDGQRGQANKSKASHQGHLLREAVGDKWIKVDVEKASDLKKISEGDLISLAVVLDSDKNIKISPNRFGMPVYENRLDNLRTFMNEAIAGGKDGDKSVKKLFGVFGDEIFNYAINDSHKFLSLGRKMGASISSMVRFTAKAKEYMQSNEAFSLLRKASVEKQSAIKLVSDFGASSFNYLEEKPWFFCNSNNLIIKYGEDSRATNAIKAKVKAMDDVFRMINGTSTDLENHATRAFWIYSALVQEGHQDGHTAVSKDDLIESAYDKQFYELEAAEKMLDLIVNYGSFVESENTNGDILISNKSDYNIEKKIIDIIKTRMSNKPKLLDDKKMKFEDFFTPEQRQAVSDAVEFNLSVITGGAGTGKTTVIKSVIQNFIDHNGLSEKDIILLAPTGKAKDRMKEATGFEAETIHKLITRQKFASELGEMKKFPGKAFIIDEAGMIDSELMLQLLKVIPDDAHVVFVGDFKQLAPVKHGQPFKDLLVTKYVPSTRLSKPQRTSSESEIHQAAMLVSEGMEPEFDKFNSEITFFPAQKDDIIVDEILRTLTDDFENKYDTKLDDTVILTPMNEYSAGTRLLNQKLKPIMNPSAEGDGIMVYFGKNKGNGKGPFHVGDRVIVNKNDSKKKIANGDVGVISKINEKGQFTVDFRDRSVDLFGFDRLKLDHAFALTVHKTQGSEYQTVIMAVSKGHKRLLSPELFYTAITRAKKNFILIGNSEGISHACSAENKQVRTTYMEAVLKKMAIDKGVDFGEQANNSKRSYSSDDFGFTKENKVDKAPQSNNNAESNNVPSNIDIIPLDAYDDSDIPPDYGDGNFNGHDDFHYSSPDEQQASVPPKSEEDPVKDNDANIDFSGINTDGKISDDKSNEKKDSSMAFDDFQF